ncbi:hypothetical protein MHU86_7477 [Fragilaria crotonensis]|nr:hypothetical protein MHU86_7477 [Fragilaria crotonensis]
MFRSGKNFLHSDKQDYDEDDVDDAPEPPRKTNVSLDDDEEEKKRSAPSASGGPTKRSKMSSFLGEEEEAHDDEEDDNESNGTHRNLHGVVCREHPNGEAREVIHQRGCQRQQPRRFRVEEEDERSVAAMPSVPHRMEDSDGWMHASYTAVSQQSLAPSLSDPRLWIVNCMPGKEEELVYQIMNKSIELAREGRHLGITGVLASQTKGKIYLESHSEAAVVDAIQGIRGIMQYSKRLVPIGDMTTAMTVKPVKMPVMENEWVRLQRWPYKGDLALVKFVHKSRQKVVVQFVPRLDLTASDLPLEQARDRRQKIRPPQKLFNAQEVGAMGMQTTRQRFLGLDIVCDVFEGNYFHEGYQLKEMTVGTMVKKVPDETSPTLHELQRFRKASKSDGADDICEENEASKSKQAGSLSRDQSVLRGKTGEKSGEARAKTGGGGGGGIVIGDTVEVIEGDLIGLRGKLISLDVRKSRFNLSQIILNNPRSLNSWQVRSESM